MTFAGLQSSRRRLAGLALGALLIAALAVFGLAGTSSRRLAPQLPTTYLSGPRVTLSSLLANAHGHRALVTFWASWCTPCGEEAGALERFALSPAGRGRIVGVDFSEGASAARGFIRRHRWTFANLRDAYGVAGNAFRMRDLPTTYAIDATGHIAQVLQGPQTLRTLTRAAAGT